MKVRCVAPMKIAKIGYIVMSVILCMVGLLFIARPGISVKVIGYVLGIMMIVFGCIRLVGYFPGICFGWHSSTTCSSALC